MSEWKSVPVEPTDEMIERASLGGLKPLPRHHVIDIWRGMLSAAPSPVEPKSYEQGLADRYFAFVEMVAAGRGPTMKDVADAMGLVRDKKRAMKGTP